MTSPEPSPDRPANTKLKALTAALVAAVGVLGVVLATRQTPQRVVICREGDVVDSAAWPATHIVPGQLEARVVAAGDSTLSDTAYVVDSTFWARVDSAQLATLHVVIVAPCDAVIPRPGLLGDSG